MSSVPRRRRLHRACAALIAVAACHRAAPAVGVAPVAAVAPTPVAQDSYESDLTGVAYGGAFARAVADGAPASDDRASVANRSADAAASRDGDEATRSCGHRGTPSHAQAAATFQPRLVAGTREFGFALSATAYARGGAWRERFVLCRKVHDTVAAADARVSGRLDLVYNAARSGSDQLVMRVSGASPDEAHLEVRDARDQLLPLTAVPGGTSVTTTLEASGPYSVRAWIASHAESDGSATGHDQRRTTFSVSVQSMRDALALGYGQDAPDVLTLPLPVFMSAEAMSAALDSAMFTVQHRLYPCAKLDCGSDRLRDIYVEAPQVSTSGGAVVVAMHLAGSYHFGLVFGGGVSGSVRAMAMPVIEHDTLRFEAPRIDVASHNLLVRWKSGSLERKLLDEIGNVRIDLGPQLATAIAKAQQQFSAVWSGACPLIEPTEAHVQSVHVVSTAPQGIIANFAIGLSGASASGCQKRDASR